MPSSKVTNSKEELLNLVYKLRSARASDAAYFEDLLRARRARRAFWHSWMFCAGAIAGWCAFKYGLASYLVSVWV